jgi:hypothetical protein
MNAYHIIGFTALELGGATYQGGTPEKIAQAQRAAKARFWAIKADGWISARCHLPQVGWNDVGRSHWQDDLAGDDRYVFLSVGDARYAEVAPPEV